MDSNPRTQEDESRAANPNNEPLVWKVSYLNEDRLNYICVIAAHPNEAKDKLLHDFEDSAKWSGKFEAKIVDVELLGEFVK